LVRPPAAIEAMLAGAEVLFEAPAQTLERAADGWIVRAPDGRAMLKADAVVLACGAGLAQFEPAAFLPLALAYGQVEWARAQKPERAVTQGGYLAPFEEGVLFGATFDKQAAEP